METRDQNITAFEEIRDRFIGTQGSPERKEYDRGFDLFMIGVAIAQAREARGLTEEQLAKMCGTTKAMINKIEMQAENCKIADLRNVVENGLGGHFNISVLF